ncbi:MAG: HupE/UreJ family protein [Bacteroidota bacterium]|nr:HupE/UreJ family protein [Bacteroidota bacterium]
MTTNSQTFKKTIAFVVFLFSSSALWAHNFNYALEKAPTEEVIWFYVKLGIEHIIPFGIDHILFVVALCLLNSKLKTILWQATAFTVAHSITLALSMKAIIVLPAAIVEPIIALSIVFVALENMIVNELKPWRVLIVFLFGLIHGLGFASALNEIGLPPGKFATSIISFNVGVELGQVFVILLTFLLLILPFGKKPWYRKRVVYPVSTLIALTGAYWTIERLLS